MARRGKGGPGRKPGRGGGGRARGGGAGKPRGGQAVSLGRRIVELVTESPKGRPVHAKLIARKLGLLGQAQRKLNRKLDELVRAGQIIDAGQGRYAPPRGDGLVEGEITRLHRERGRDEGASIATGTGEVWRVPRAGEAQLGDRVLLQPIGAADKGRAELVRVVGGSRDRLVGILEKVRGGAEVTPYRDDARWRIHVPERSLAGAKPGEVVVVETLPAAKKSRTRGRPVDAAPTGRVVERIGRPGTPEADFRAVVWHRRLPVEFPPEVLAEVEGLPDTLSPRAIEGRLDLRDRDFLTIDPATARDHDDAVCVEPAEGGGHVLMVAIADVAHYVRAGTRLDREAERRGNSVYFPDRAIPMLPERLSTDLCSLRPDVDRLAMVVKLVVDRGGRTHKPSFHEAVIRSRGKLAYEDAAAVLEGRAGDRAIDPAVAAQVEALGTISKRLRREREKGGALDFELPAPVVELDDQGRVKDIRRFERSDAHRAIEDAMLAANQAVARFLSGEGLATIHRVHESPDDEALDTLGELFVRVGLVDSVPAHIDTPALQRVLEEARGHKAERLVHMMTLRAMTRARYSDEPLGHFALAFDHYLHFTSPIRRYADLVVHRTLKARLARGAAASNDTSLAHLAARLSALERRAVVAERDMLDLKKAALMAGRLGAEFDGAVSGAAEQGIYVTLDHPFVEGLVPARLLPESCTFDPEALKWVGARGGPSFGLGDRLEVRVVSVDQLRGWVNFGLVDEKPAQPPTKGRPRARPTRPKAAPSRGKGARRRS